MGVASRRSLAERDYNNIREITGAVNCTLGETAKPWPRSHVGDGVVFPCQILGPSEPTARTRFAENWLRGSRKTPVEHALNAGSPILFPTGPPSKDQLMDPFAVFSPE